MTRPSPQTERVVMLLELMTQRPQESFTLAEISRRLGVHKQTCHSMLVTLVDAGWLIRHPTRKTYRLGPALATIGRAASADTPIIEFAHATMQDLAEQVDQNVLLLERVDDHTVVIDAARPKRRPQAAVSIGQQFPLLAPIGGAIVAWDPDRIEHWVRGASDDDAARYRQSLESVRGRGFEVRIDVAAPLLEELRARLTSLRADDAGDLVEEFATRLVGEQDELDHIDDDTDYALSGISAPVFDTPDAPPRFAMAITFRSGSNQVRGRDIWEISERLLAGTRSLSRSLGGPRNRAGILQPRPPP